MKTFTEVLGGAGIECSVSSMEDTLLLKLEWFRAGSEISERQWSDVVGMWNAGGSQADVEYLRLWAKRIGVEDLLEKLTGR